MAYKYLLSPKEALCLVSGVVNGYSQDEDGRWTPDSKIDSNAWLDGKKRMGLKGLKCFDERQCCLLLDFFIHRSDRQSVRVALLSLEEVTERLRNLATYQYHSKEFHQFVEDNSRAFGRGLYFMLKDIVDGQTRLCKTIKGELLPQPIEVPVFLSESTVRDWARKRSYLEYSDSRHYTSFEVERWKQEAADFGVHRFGKEEPVIVDEIEGVLVDAIAASPRIEKLRQNKNKKKKKSAQSKQKQAPAVMKAKLV